MATLNEFTHGEPGIVKHAGKTFKVYYDGTVYLRRQDGSTLRVKDQRMADMIWDMHFASHDGPINPAKRVMP